MSDKVFVDEKRLKKLLNLIERVACKNNRDEQLNLLYKLAPEIKIPHRQLTLGH